MRHRPDFDRIARLYRWLEYASLGTLLEQVRRAHLERLHRSRRALVLGDGDGRFTAALLKANAQVRIEAVDLSRAMLRLLRQRTQDHRDRIVVRRGEVCESALPPGTDLIVTHFLLDCLAQAEVDALVERLAGSLAPGGLWLLSEFRVPGGWLRWPARGYVRALYLAFRLLTGLRTDRLPDHEPALATAGMVRVALTRRMGGMLTGELWQKPAREPKTTAATLVRKPRQKQML